MQYETVILEMLSRIKTLEEEVLRIKERLEGQISEDVTRQNREEVTQPQTSYTKMNDKMMEWCYTYGKRMYEDNGGNPWDYASYVSEQTGMNINSAFIYIYAVRYMLEGAIYKRGINAKAMEYYLDRIYREYGQEGLEKALRATKMHIEYRKSCNHPVDKMERIYQRFVSEFNR